MPPQPQALMTASRLTLYPSSSISFKNKSRTRPTPLARKNRPHIFWLSVFSLLDA